MIRKRIIENIDGEPVEIEIEDGEPKPKRYTLDEFHQLLMQAEYIADHVTDSMDLPGHFPRHGRKRKPLAQ